MVHITVTVVTNKETQNMRETSCVLSSVRMTENSFDVSVFFLTGQTRVRKNVQGR